MDLLLTMLEVIFQRTFKPCWKKSWMISKQSPQQCLGCTGPGAWIDVLKEFKEQNSVIDYIVFPEDFKKYFQPAFDKRKNLQDHWSVKQESQSIFLND